MLETIKFPVGTCPSCGPNVLLAGDLDERDDLVHVCAHCGVRVNGAGPPRELGASTLKHYGYLVDGELESRGCGDDNGGGCGGSCAC